MKRWPTLPDHLVIGSKVFVRGLEGDSHCAMPRKWKDRIFRVELVDYERAEPLGWSTWRIRYVEPAGAELFHDQPVEWFGNEMKFTGDRLGYRTLYESALARAIVDQ